MKAFITIPVLGCLLAASLAFAPVHAAPATLHGDEPATETTASDDIPAALRAQYEAAYFAWDRGDYIEALALLEEILNASGSDALLERIALLTGELYQVEEIAADGRNVQWSAGGRYVAYQTGAGAESMTHLVGMRGQQPAVDAVEGEAAVFSPQRQELAYLQLRETPEIEAAREAEQEALDAGDFQEVRRLRQQIAQLQAATARVYVLDVESGEEADRTPEGISRVALFYAGDGTLLVVGQAEDTPERMHLFTLPEDGTPERLTEDAGLSGSTLLAAGTDRIIYSPGSRRLAIYHMETGETTYLDGTAPAVSRDGSTLAYLTTVREVDEELRRGEGIVGADVRATGHLRALMVKRLDEDSAPTEIRRTTLPIASPAVSPSGERVAYMLMLRDDWELFTASTTSGEETRVTREIQQDYFPQFLTENRLMGLMGEARHRRSYVYELDRDSSEVHADRLLPGRDMRGRARMFHNNTLRTVAPQYEWEPSPDGSQVLVVADRDGDTVSPERGVYVVHLDQPVTRDEVLERIATNLERERDLRERGRAMFEPIAEEVRAATQDVEVGRIYDYAHALYQMGVKWYEAPGKLDAINYLADKLEQMGYEPEIQWFEPQEGVRTANVIATLPGTERPDEIYVISSHFDSVPRSPGADDNSSGTTALLEAARVLADRPQAATIKFAFLGAEEAGLIGAREWVRRALDEEVDLAGVINNDMLGWTRSHRLDNTIRYSNAGIRDIQHAAAIQFSDLILYDARYVRGTDAAAFYDGYGDIIGGIGAYPILGNPHYHQPHDMLEGINQRLVAEVSRTTVGAIMRLASGPRPLAELEVRETSAGSYEASWSSVQEAGPSRAVVAYGPPQDPQRHTQTVDGTRTTLEGIAPGWHVAVKAVDGDGLTSWDWTRTTVPDVATSDQE